MTLTAERLREVLSYEPETGVFRRLVVSKFANKSRGAKVGEVVGHPIGKGYIGISVDGRCYYAHRLAVLYMTGKWPASEVDHENLIKTDNRWVNLREATPTQNKGNVAVRKSNSSGFKGVHWAAGNEKWHAMIRLNGERVYLGQFDTREEAGAAYSAAAIEHFGEFARF